MSLCDTITSAGQLCKKNDQKRSAAGAKGQFAQSPPREDAAGSESEDRKAGFALCMLFALGEVN